MTDTGRREQRAADFRLDELGCCPRCGQTAILDALSRNDNETKVCEDCGTEEALNAAYGRSERLWHADEEKR